MKAYPGIRILAITSVDNTIRVKNLIKKGCLGYLLQIHGYLKPLFLIVSNASFVLNGKAYVGLGRDITSPFIFGCTKVFEYTASINTDSWIPIPDMNADRTYSVGFSVNNIGYMGLGTPIGAVFGMKDIWAYKP